MAKKAKKEEDKKPEPPKELTDKQKRFCEEYVIDWNATRAAIAAGYSKKTAKQQGHQLLDKTLLKDYIEEIQKDLAKLAGVSALGNMLELKKIVNANIAQFAKGWSTLEEWSKISDDDKAALSEISFDETYDKEGNKTTKVKYKLHDKQKAITTLNQMNGWATPDKEGQTGVIILNGGSLFTLQKEED